MAPLTTEARKAKEDRFAALIANARAQVELAKKEIIPEPVKLETEHLLSLNRQTAKTEGLVWNAKQQEAISLAEKGKSFCLIGAAGTGKTTVMREILRRLQQAGKVGPLHSSTKYLVAGQPGAVVLSYTNKAVANIRRGMPKDIACLTAHKLIEFQPHFYEVQNSEGDWIKTMRFEPARTRFNPLPRSLCVIGFEESGTISTDLFKQLTDAMHGTEQFIFLGDIQQLPPVYGQAILGFKMLELPTVELDEVHRQAADSPILSCAWKLLDGKPIAGEEIKREFDTPGKFLFNVWKPIQVNSQEDHEALRIKQTALFIRKYIEEESFDPLSDMILIPFNKAYGTLELNKEIADYLGRKREAEVVEVIAGFRKFYFAIGDKVLVNKQEALVERISKNANYVGKQPIEPSTRLNRWGHYNFENKEEAEALHQQEMSLEDLELLLASQSAMDSGEIEERKNQGSHILHCRMLDSDEEVEVQTTGEYQETLFAYALTVHKAQGSEWRRVVLFFDGKLHATMISRELLYTAITRARETLTIFGPPDLFKKGILRQRIKGNTLEEKAEYFKGKLEQLVETEEEENEDE